jgi:hypothetical protein
MIGLNFRGRGRGRERGGLNFQRKSRRRDLNF